eukprot:CAMPEP_0202905612 /NCGR_PEP_ID=MMETSP1392-20130828/35273_1 /ASSEMBLY_ACC=CAM_ASM_000868 /TAXON_ID=225041 /ORGANISM="Chlamydomonas chlamydogama, Strain SAG 11-48b" /LENGTH=32 /DNA_ID= /DNA_START= /DNA_END= /DNA_ORIENTATION=
MGRVCQLVKILNVIEAVESPNVTWDPQKWTRV